MTRCGSNTFKLSLVLLLVSSPYALYEVTPQLEWLWEVTTFAILNVMIAVIVESTLDEASFLSAGQNWVLNGLNGLSKREPNLWLFDG